ncbi:branched-chain amino acid ABC transporter permease [Rhodovibrio sodomensis]|uniref:Branched-chain amino acid ABC transporter permease n=1 Tax=Rhodovibrio sodomensis TaxID=1088 RepID=A0ABS1DM49_9PROT|nr:branched-chain amino acid ABC transporter permease [Rhodovibrio sodomensis]MBK1671203.1 branched-chain amino acid ABC transporter permease [Rhodovibrio sodomensis]
MTASALSAAADGRPAGRRCAVGIALGIFVLLALTPLLSQLYGGGYLTTLAMRAMILAIAAISLDLLIGQGGMVSFGHAAFVALGAYAYGIAIDEGVYSIFAILPAAFAAAGLFALVTGAISLRTRGVYFIMITLAFAQMLYFAMGSLSRYGADDGLTLWSSADVAGTGLLKSDTGLFLSILAALVGVWLLVNRIAVSRFGRVLRAARQNPTRVATMGYSVFRYRLTAYVIAALIAALAGVFWGAQANFVSPAIGSWQRSGDLIAIVVLGGMGSRNGALIGALFLVFIEEVLSGITHDWRLIFGPMLVLIALYAHGGLAGWIERLQGPRRSGGG